MADLNKNNLDCTQGSTSEQQIYQERLQAMKDYFGPMNPMNKIRNDEYIFYPENLPSDTELLSDQSGIEDDNFDYSTAFKNMHLASNSRSYMANTPAEFIQPMPVTMDYSELTYPYVESQVNPLQWPDSVSPILSAQPSVLPGLQLEHLQFRHGFSHNPTVPSYTSKTFKDPEPPIKFHSSEELTEETYTIPQNICQGTPAEETVSAIPDTLDFGKLGGGYGKKVSTRLEDKFSEQIKKFYQLPLVIHKKIQNMSAYEITDYFEVKVVRLREGNIIEAHLCHTVFARSPETEKRWLMAFLVSDRMTPVFKFNRLLTGRLKSKTCGKTAVELEAPPYPDDGDVEVFIFNFTSETTASKFIDVVDKAKNQIWNDAKRPEQIQLPIWPVPMPLLETKPGDCFIRRDFPSSQPSSSKELLIEKVPRNFSYPKSDIHNILDHSSFLKTIPEQLLSKPVKINTVGIFQACNKPKLGDESKVVKYITNATLFINTYAGYVTLGNGKLSIISKKGCFDEFMLTGIDDEVICRHYIYKWNTMKREKNKELYICKWNAVANFYTSETKQPLLRDFKIENKSMKKLYKFYKAFLESIKKGAELVASQNY